MSSTWNGLTGSPTFRPDRTATPARLVPTMTMETATAAMPLATLGRISFSLGWTRPGPRVPVSSLQRSRQDRIIPDNHGFLGAFAPAFRTSPYNLVRRAQYSPAPSMVTLGFFPIG